MRQKTITAELQQEIRETFGRCLLFEEERAVRHFVSGTPSLQPLQARLPLNAQNQQEMHIQLIRYLASNAIRGRNGLSIFLHEASTLLDAELDCHQTLLDLAERVQQAVTPQPKRPSSEQSEPPKPAREAFCAEANLVRVCLDPVADENDWQLLLVNDSDHDLQRVHVILEATIDIHLSRTRFHFHTVPAARKTEGQPITIQPNQEPDISHHALPFSIVYVANGRRERVNNVLPIPS